MPDEPVPDDAGGLRAVNARLRAVVEAKDAEIAGLRAEADAARERERRLELRLAELERRLGMDSTDSGTPSSRERIGAKQARRARQQSERERRTDRKRGGQPGHQGNGLARDPEPDERKDAEPPAECRRCRAGLDGAAAAPPRWAQVIDVEVTRKVTEWRCQDGRARAAGRSRCAEPPGVHAGSVSYGPALNAAAVVLTSYGNVPPERAAQVMGMLLGVPASAGWVDKAAGRVSALLAEAGFGEAMTAALAAERVLAAGETPVNVPGGTTPPARHRTRRRKRGPREAGDGRVAARADRPYPRRAADVPAGHRLPAQGRHRGRPASPVHRDAITDGYTAYQHLLEQLAGIQQCCAHVIRRCRAVAKPGPGSLQSGPATSSPSSAAHTRQWKPHAPAPTPRWTPTCSMACGNATTRRLSQASSHNRLRDWDTGNHPGYALGCWLRDHKEQVLLSTRDSTVDWTNNVSERGAKAARRHQAVSGYWHSLATLARWCRIRSYLDTAAAHGITALDAIRAAIEGKPWLPPLPAHA